MNAAELVRATEATGARLEPRGEQIWCSNPTIAERMIDELKANRQAVLLFLRRREYGRLKHSAETLALFLDDTGFDLEIRRPRLPEYVQLLEQIAELESYISSGVQRETPGS